MEGGGGGGGLGRTATEQQAWAEHEDHLIWPTSKRFVSETVFMCYHHPFIHPGNQIYSHLIVDKKTVKLELLFYLSSRSVLC
jgi:hypothetical protein